MPQNLCVYGIGMILLSQIAFFAKIEGLIVGNHWLELKIDKRAFSPPGRIYGSRNLQFANQVVNDDGAKHLGAPPRSFIFCEGPSLFLEIA